MRTKRQTLEKHLETEDETSAILSDPAIMASLKRSEEDLAAGRVRSHEEIKRLVMENNEAALRRSPAISAS